MGTLVVDFELNPDHLKFMLEYSSIQQPSLLVKSHEEDRFPFSVIDFLNRV